MAVIVTVTQKNLNRMTTLHLYFEAIRRGLTIEPHGPAHLSVGPNEILEADLEFREQVRAHRAELMALLRALHTAKQILCGEFDGNRAHVQMLASQMLQSEQHPLCALALQRVSRLQNTTNPETKDTE